MTRESMTTLFNPNTTPVVCDRDGHIVEGGGRRQVEKVDKIGQEAVDHGLLVVEPGDDEPEGDGEESAGEVKDKAAEPRKGSGASAPKKNP